MDDTNKNVASGNYSTAHGFKNSCTSSYAFAVGYNNEVTHTIDYTAIAIGGDNKVRGGIALGAHNSVTGYGALGTFLDNTGGDASVGNRKGLVIGYANNTTLLFPERSKNAPAALVVGAGAVYRPENAIECYDSNGTANNSLVAFPTSISLSNKVIVNAITSPQDPDNVTADDKTLVTVGYIQGIYQKSQVAYFSEYDTAISVPVDGTGIDVETSLGAIPTWANRLIITFRWENELFVKEIHFTKNEGVHLYVVQRAYSTFPETIAYKHLRLEWDYTNKTLTAADYWTYDQDMANAGAIANWDHTLANAPTCKILSAVYSE